MEAYIDLISRPEGYMDLNAVPEPAGGGVALTDTTPYLYRISADGQNIGSQEFDEIVGGTVAWNQYTLAMSTYSPTGATASATESEVTLTVNSTGVTNGRVRISKTGSIKAPIGGHKYLISADVQATKAHSVTIYNGNSLTVSQSGLSASAWHTICGIKTQAQPTGLYHQIDVYGTFEVGDVVSIKNFKIMDLTQMFGSTIADYIYSLENAHTGDGVAWFKNLFPNDYYAYNAGELLSVNTSAHKMVGFNQFDISEFVRLYPSACTLNADELNVNAISSLYSTGVPVNILADVVGAYITADIKCGTASRVRFRVIYDDGTAQETSGVSSTSYTHVQQSLNNKRIVAIRLNWTTSGTFSIKNLCINLSLDASKNGTYEPYISHSYPLDSSLTLRGIPKLDGNNKLSYDGDIYSSDGTVTRKYGIVDLGTLNWSYGNGLFSCGFTSLNGKYKGNLICPRYQMKTVPLNPTEDGIMYMANSVAIPILRVSDFAYTDAATFKTAMSEVYLVYELAEPTTETATPYTNPQIVAKGGTEEYVDTRDVAIPVGHNTKYQGVLL